MQLALLIYESPEAFATGNNEDTDWGPKAGVRSLAMKKVPR